MEDDSSGNFGGVSMDTLIRKGYEGNSHIHTNSWGTDGYYGEYTTSSEDTDSRTSRYDQFWSYDAACSYWSRQGTMVQTQIQSHHRPLQKMPSPLAITTIVEGAPSNLADSSSRGPTDDGRIKPDVTASGSWVRSCLSQDASDTGVQHGAVSGTSNTAVHPWLLSMRQAPQSSFVNI